MLSTKRTHPMIGMISELLIGVNPSSVAPTVDILMTSPKSPLDFKILPQRNSSKRFYDDSVGLGILATLENSNTRRIRSLCRSELNQSNFSDQFLRHEGSVDGGEEDEEMFLMDEEDYMYGPSGSCSTKVYERDGFDCFASKINEDISVRLFMVDDSPDNSPAFHGLGFLNSCYLCSKKLHGQDIFIYRGDKAFCSTECRSSHIANDERKERCISKFSTSDPYTAGQIFSTGVLVT